MKPSPCLKPGMPSENHLRIRIMKLLVNARCMLDVNTKDITIFRLTEYGGRLVEPWDNWTWMNQNQLIALLKDPQFMVGVSSSTKPMHGYAITHVNGVSIEHEHNS